MVTNEEESAPRTLYVRQLRHSPETYGYGTTGEQSRGALGGGGTPYRPTYVGYGSGSPGKAGAWRALYDRATYGKSTELARLEDVAPPSKYDLALPDYGIGSLGKAGAWRALYDPATSGKSRMMLLPWEKDDVAPPSNYELSSPVHEPHAYAIKVRLPVQVGRPLPPRGYMPSRKTNLHYSQNGLEIVPTVSYRHMGMLFQDSVHMAGCRQRAKAGADEHSDYMRRMNQELFSMPKTFDGEVQQAARAAAERKARRLQYA